AEAHAVRERPERPIEAGRGDLEDVFRERLLERVEDCRRLARGGLAVVERHAARPVDEERQRGASAGTPVGVTELEPERRQAPREETRRPRVDGQVLTAHVVAVPLVWAKKKRADALFQDP